MTDRPSKLSLPAQLVVWGSKRLTPTEKILWYHHWFLDQGREDGCYISARSLATRLGLSQSTIEDGRKRLRALGLLTSWCRREGREYGFRSTLPFTAPKTFAEVTDEWIAALDLYIEKASPPGSAPGAPPPAQRGPPPGSRRGGGGEAAAEGGRGEGASSASRSIAQLSSRLAVREDAEGAEEAREGSARKRATTKNAPGHIAGPLAEVMARIGGITP